MYDSENISLVTRVEAGVGVTMAYKTNSEGESVFVASIDSDYIANLVVANAGGSLALSPTDEARLAKLESIISSGRPPGADTTPPPEPAAASTPGTTEVNFLINGSLTGVTDTSTPTTIDYSLVDASGSKIITETMTVSAGAAANVFELGMYSQIKRNGGFNTRVTPTYVDGKLILTWIGGRNGQTFVPELKTYDPDDKYIISITDIDE